MLGTINAKIFQFPCQNFVVYEQKIARNQLKNLKEIQKQ